MPVPHRPRRRQLGLSLGETLIALAVLTVATGSAVPSFTALRQRQQLQAAAARFDADVQFAAASAQLQAQPVRLSFVDGPDVAAAPRCWLVHTGHPDACRCDAAAGTASCDAPARLLRASPLPPGTELRLVTSAASLVFAPERHTVSPAATLTLRTPGGPQARQIVSVTGRVRGCSPDGDLPGWRAC